MVPNVIKDTVKKTTQVEKSCRMHQDLATNLAASLARSCCLAHNLTTFLQVLQDLLPRILQDYLDVQESCKGRNKIPVQDLSRTLARSCMTFGKKSCEILLAQFFYISCTKTPETYHVALLYPFAVSSWTTLGQIQATVSAEIKSYYKLITSDYVSCCSQSSSLITADECRTWYFTSRCLLN